MFVAPMPSWQAQYNQKRSEHRTDNVANSTGASVHKPRSHDEPGTERDVEKAQWPCDLRHGNYRYRDDQRADQMVAVSKRRYIPKNEPGEHQESTDQHTDGQCPWDRDPARRRTADRRERSIETGM